MTNTTGTPEAEALAVTQNTTFDAWLKRYVADWNPNAMRFSVDELRIAFDAGAVHGGVGMMVARLTHPQSSDVEAGREAEQRQGGDVGCEPASFSCRLPGQATLPQPVASSTGERERADKEFADAVWNALKDDANDLRKQQRILMAFRSFCPASVQHASLKRQHAWSGDGNQAEDGYDGPICLRCGLPDLPSTDEECRR